MARRLITHLRHVDLAVSDHARQLALYTLGSAVDLGDGARPGG